MNRYKKTELGEIPEEWKVVRLGEVLTLKNGERPVAVDDGTFPIYGANGITGYTSNSLVDNDFTIVIGRVGASGEVHIVDGKAWISDNAIYSERYNKSKVYLQYLFYLLKFKNLSKYATKSTHPIITQSFLNSFTIPLPPLPEQQKIAEVLSTVDEAIQKVSEAIAKTERLKKGLMQRLLTRGIGHERFKFSKELGCEVPEEWEVVRLGDVADLVMGQSPPGETYNEEGKGKPFLQGKADFGSLHPKHIKYTTKPLKIAKKGSILLSVRAPVGDVNLSDIDYCIGRGLSSLSLRKGDNIFLFYLLYYHKSEIEKEGTGSTFKAINKIKLQNIKIPLPPLPEQQKIAEVLSTVDEMLELERERKGKLERLKKGLMQALLTGKVRLKAEKFL